MDDLRKRWWQVTAGIIAIAIATFGMGNLIEDDGGPLYGKVIAAVLALAIAALIVSGLVVQTRNRSRGSYMICFGVLPGTVLTMLFWFPPVALTGLLSIFVAWSAFRDAVDHQHIEHEIAQANPASG